MISSENFAKICGCVLDPHYSNTYRASKRVYVSGEQFIFERVLQFLKTFQEKYTLVYHRTDATFDRFKFECVKPYVEHVYAVNCEICHPMITQIPLGFADGKYPTEIGDYEKDILCYVNMGLYNDTEIQFVKCRSIRQDCLAYFKSQKFATFDEPTLSFDDFSKKMKRSRFVVCPFGYGMDTHRFYETCAVGAVPIVMSSGLDHLYEKFGALIVHSWDEVTEDRLAQFQKKTVDMKKLLTDCEQYLKPSVHTELPVSIGEALDKLSILDIKLDRIHDGRRIDVQNEYDVIYKKTSQYVEAYPDLYSVMKKVNILIWDLMDILRDGTVTVKECTDCIKLNDVRFRIKSKINYRSASELKEQKGYQTSRLAIHINYSLDNILDFVKPIRYYSLFYDEVHVECPNQKLRNVLSDDPTIKFESVSSPTYSFPNATYTYDTILSIFEITHQDLIKFFSM